MARFPPASENVRSFKLTTLGTRQLPSNLLDASGRRANLLLLLPCCYASCPPAYKCNSCAFTGEIRKASSPAWTDILARRGFHPQTQ